MAHGVEMGPGHGLGGFKVKVLSVYFCRLECAAPLIVTATTGGGIIRGSVLHRNIVLILIVEVPKGANNEDFSPMSFRGGVKP